MQHPREEKEWDNLHLVIIKDKTLKRLFEDGQLEK